MIPVFQIFLHIGDSIFPNLFKILIQGFSNLSCEWKLQHYFRKMYARIASLIQDLLWSTFFKKHIRTHTSIVHIYSVLARHCFFVWAFFDERGQLWKIAVLLILYIENSLHRYIWETGIWFFSLKQMVSLHA